MNVTYGVSGFASVVQGEIDARRQVALIVRGRRRRIALRILALYAIHELHPSESGRTRAMYAGMAWRSFLIPTFMGLCVHARQAGMSIKAYEKPDCLEVHFEPVE